MSELAERLTIGDAVFARVDTDESLACWTLVRRPGEANPVNLVIEPAAEPGPDVLRVAELVVSRFDEFARSASDFLREQLPDPQFGLTEPELDALNRQHPPFGSPEAVIWIDATWMLNFTESNLAIAEPYGVGVLFNEATPIAVEDLSNSETL